MLSQSRAETLLRLIRSSHEIPSYWCSWSFSSDGRRNAESISLRLLRGCSVIRERYSIAAWHSSRRRGGAESSSMNPSRELSISLLLESSSRVSVRRGGTGAGDSLSSDSASSKSALLGTGMRADPALGSGINYLGTGDNSSVGSAHDCRAGG